MWEPQLWRRWSHSEYEVLVFLSRLCIRPDATHLRPHASYDPAPIYRGQNLSPSCKQADKDNLIDVGAAHWWKRDVSDTTLPSLPFLQNQISHRKKYSAQAWSRRVSFYIHIKRLQCIATTWWLSGNTFNWNPDTQFKPSELLFVLVMTWIRTKTLEMCKIMVEM